MIPLNTDNWEVARKKAIEIFNSDESCRGFTIVRSKADNCLYIDELKKASKNTMGKEVKI